MVLETHNYNRLISNKVSNQNTTNADLAGVGDRFATRSRMGNSSHIGRIFRVVEMRASVLPEPGALRVSLTADFTDIRSVAGVHSDVVVEG